MIDQSSFTFTFLSRWGSFKRLGSVRFFYAFEKVSKTCRLFNGWI